MGINSRLDKTCPFYYEDKIDAQVSIDICHLTKKEVTDCVGCKNASKQFNKRMDDISTNANYIRKYLSNLFDDTDLTDQPKEDRKIVVIDIHIDDEGLTGRAYCSNCHKTVDPYDIYCKHCGCRFEGHCRL